MKQVLLLLLLLPLTVGCGTSRRGGGDERGGGGGDDDDAGGPCGRFLECVGAADPEDHADLFAQYGPGGTCWDSGEEATEICEAACEAQLDSYDDYFGEPECRARRWPYSGDSVAGEGWDAGDVTGDIVGFDQYGQLFDVDWLAGSWVLVVAANNPNYWSNSATAQDASNIQEDYAEDLDGDFWVVLAPFFEGDAAEQVASDHGFNDLPVVQDDSLGDEYDGQNADTFPGPFLILNPDGTVEARLTIDDLDDLPSEADGLIRGWLDDVLF